MASSIITIIGFKLAAKPADDEHPFGHERIEYICGLIISFFILFIGFELCKTSIDKIINPSLLSSTYLYLTVILLVVAIIIKLWQNFTYRKIAKKIDSIVLIGILLSYHVFNFNLDGYIGLVVALFILYSGISLIKTTISPLIGGIPEETFIKNILNDIKKYEGVLGVHDMVCHTYGKTKCFMTIHVEVSSKENILISHDLIDNIEKDIKEKYNVEICIHLDPIEIDNEELNIIKKELHLILNSIDINLKFHDLRMIKGYTHTNLIFDVVVPYEFNLSNLDLKNLIIQKIKELNNQYKCVIQIEKSYIGNLD